MRIICCFVSSIFLSSDTQTDDILIKSQNNMWVCWRVMNMMNWDHWDLHLLDLCLSRLKGHQPPQKNKRVTCNLPIPGSSIHGDNTHPEIGWLGTSLSSYRQLCNSEQWRPRTSYHFLWSHYIQGSYPNVHSDTSTFSWTVVPEPRFCSSWIDWQSDILQSDTKCLRALLRLDHPGQATWMIWEASIPDI